MFIIEIIKKCGELFKVGSGALLTKPLLLDHSAWAAIFALSQILHDKKIGCWAFTIECRYA
jgi:hypothetical protein